MVVMLLTIIEVLDKGTALKVTAPSDLANGDYDITLVDGSGVQFPCGKIKVTTEPRPSMETTLWEGEFAVTWGSTIRGLEGNLPLKGEGWHHPPCLCGWKRSGYRYHSLVEQHPYW